MPRSNDFKRAIRCFRPEGLPIYEGRVGVKRIAHGLSDLDIKHRIRGRAGEGLQGYRIKVGGEFGGDAFPDAADDGAGIAVVEGGVLELGRLYGIDDLAEADVFRGAGKEVASVGTAAGVDETGAAEVV